MLGEKIGEDVAKVVGQRLIPVEGGSPRIEVTIQGSGKLLGVDFTSTITYVATPTQFGVLNGEGWGILTTKDGELVSCRGYGVGRPTGPGGATRWAGLMCYQTASQKLSRLNSLATVFEHDVNANGDGKGASWEWK